MQAEIFRVGLVPSELSAYPERTDGNYITTSAGLFPDPLVPLDGSVSIASEKWRAIWISIPLPAGLPAGDYPIAIRFTDDAGAEVGSLTYTVSVEPVTLPRQKLLFTQWFHCDCIAQVHGVPVFSETHWKLMERYLRLAARHGMNMVLTPVLTPPLDTAIGSERPTVQLVDVVRENGSYTFGFDRLERFVRMAQSCGIEQFEINHFFTQWGAYCAPKVIATENGTDRRIFGWDTSATSPEYREFLQALIPALLEAFARFGITREKLWFHVSDEPAKAHLESYAAAKGILSPLVAGCHEIDALSDFDFYSKGLVTTPVVATNRLAPFLEANIRGLWCYYCCSQVVAVSNRLFAMPSARNRIIGAQLYREQIVGFLHWGYNFYFSQFSKRLLDPYRETDSGGAFPSGDAFSVYPYLDGAIPSLRLKVFARALEDMRLLELLEARIGREETVRLLDMVAGARLRFDSYPQDEKFFRTLYDVIFDRLKQD